MVGRGCARVVSREGLRGRGQAECPKGSQRRGYKCEVLVDVSGMMVFSERPWYRRSWAP